MLELKNCYKCKTKKPFSDFHKNRSKYDGLDTACKECKKSPPKPPKVEITHKVCPLCKKDLPVASFYKSVSGYYNSRCKTCFKAYYKDRELAVKAYKHEYYIINKKDIEAKALANSDRRRENVRIYQKRRRQEDVIFKLSGNLRNRIFQAFKKRKWYKNGTQKLIGISFELAKRHIERQFTKGMTWENYGKWHIDHIIPLASAKTEEELKKLCHYRNLQPLWAVDNRIKHCAILKPQLSIAI